MARRNGKRGDYLYTDDYTDTADYASRMRTDFWNDRTSGKILLRNLQEIATPLNDPYPVPIYSGPSYEQTNGCIAESIPIYIGNTTRPFPTNSAVVQAFPSLNPSIGNMSVGCTFIVF